MTNEPLITITGNLGDDPELRFTPGGVAVCNFSVANTPRVKNGDEWQDGTTTWFRCAVWRDMAENVVESLRRGMPVIVQGYLSTEEYEARDGSGKRSQIQLNVQAIGPNLRMSTAQVSKPPKSHAGPPPQQPQQRQQERSPEPPPWAQ